MNFSKFILSFLLVFGNFAFSQHQKYTMAEAVNGLRTNLAVENISSPSWLEEGQFIQVKDDAYWVTNIQTMETQPFLSLKDLGTNSLPNVKFTDSKSGYYKIDSTYYTIAKTDRGWKSKEWIYLPKKAENIEIIGKAKAAVYTIDNNLFYKDSDKTIDITQDKNKDIVNGQAVHRNEFGINGGIFIAPNQEKLVFYRMDQTMVADYPIIDWSVVPAENHNIKYPMAGQTSHEVKLGIFDVKNLKKIFLNIDGPKDQYLTAVSWSPDSKYVLVGVLNRDQNHLKFNMYDAKTGQFVKTIFEETSDKYVEPEHSVVFLPNSNTDFIWQSQRTGFNHLFLYNIDKGLVKQLTKGDWLVTDVLGFNAKKNEVYFASTKESPLERHLYKVNWNSLDMKRLDKAEGIHSGILSPEGNFLYDAYINADTPRKIDVINTHQFTSKKLLTAKDPLKNYDRPEIKNVTLKAEDGTPLYGKLILPTDFDTSKKYPVIVYLYNGPHAQLVTNTYPASANLWYEYMAQNGYVVFTMDGRGSSNRGMAFEQAVFRNLGETEMKDQLKGVEYLKSLSYVDADKMGVHGWSFGGFMTTSLMLKYPEVFKVGVAGGPVIDWNMYEVMYTERYMDSPKDNPQGYAQANLLDKVQNLKGHLLMIHGAQDDVVVWQHSIKFLKSAVDNGVQLDYFVYPGHPHNVRGKDRVHLMQKVTDYFDLYLKK